MMRHKGKRLVLTASALVILGAGLLLAWLDITPAGAQGDLEEDELAALAAWGTTEDPNIGGLLASQAD